jgi:hypothetical protein
MTKQTAAANPPPAEHGTAVPTSPQVDTSEAGKTKAEAGAERQVPAAPSNPAENNLLLTAGRHVKQPAERDDGGCFEPFIPSVSVSPGPKLAPKPKPPTIPYLLDKFLHYNGIDPTPKDTKLETGLPAPAAAEGTCDARITQPSEILPAPVEAPLPPPRVATAVELFTWTMRCVLAQTHLPEDAAEFVAFWVISTWFQDALTILPCLVITGPAHDAGVVLHVLSDFCRQAALLAGFGRSHLSVLQWGCKTNLVSEPNLDKRTANLLSSLTDRRFLVVEGGTLARFSKSTAIFAGENPETHKIQNSIHIHIAPTNAAPPAPPQWLQKMIERVPVHLDQYRNKNFSYVRHWTRVLSGVSSETAAIATALGRCIVDAPELQQKLVTLLKTQDQQRLSEMSDTSEAIVLEATRALSRDGREQAYAREIAVKANQILETRGETTRLSPEKVGHRLKKLGLLTRPLSQTGNGLTFDKAAVTRIHELAAMYMVDVMEDTPTEAKNLHSSQTTENK